jgi:hypothetical protein
MVWLSCAGPACLHLAHLFTLVAAILARSGRALCRSFFPLRWPSLLRLPVLLDLRGGNNCD